MHIIQSDNFSRWLAKLRDDRARTRVVARLSRLQHGLAGDVKPVGQGISELRIHYGPGYRVYYHQHGDILILLLCAGDKSSQSSDIAIAHNILKEWREQHG